jgi:hypothetical protein
MGRDELATRFRAVGKGSVNFGSERGVWSEGLGEGRSEDRRHG